MISSSIPSKNPASWLSHLDGLRGIALLGVLFFHFELLGQNGGFTGVDVFFVLSGFLMTRNICSKIAKNTFTLFEFYRTRFWRLYPSSVLTSLLTLLAAWHVFPANLALDVGKSALASMFFSSNILFSTEVGGYFDKAVTRKPLLHTWSLSLEEQFYFFWPIFLFLSASFIRAPDQPSKKFFAIISALSIASFILTLTTVYTYPTFAWYWLPTRVYEFTIGAIAHLLYNTEPSVFLVADENMRKTKLTLLRMRQITEEVVAVASLAAILISYVYVTTDKFVFPGWASLPCLFGTFYLIITPNTLVARYILSNSIMAFLGKISYAAYLVHWPLWVYFIYIRGAHERGALLFVITLFLAYLQLQLFENPMRLSSGRVRQVAFTLLYIVTLLVALNCILSKGWDDGAVTYYIDSPFIDEPIPRTSAARLREPSPSLSSSSNSFMLDSVATDSKRHPPPENSNKNGVVQTSTQDIKITSQQASSDYNPDDHIGVPVWPKDYPLPAHNKLLRLASEFNLSSPKWFKGNYSKIRDHLYFIGGMPSEEIAPSAIVVGDSFMGNADLPLAMAANESGTYFVAVVSSGCYMRLGGEGDLKVLGIKKMEICTTKTKIAEVLAMGFATKVPFVLVFRWHSSPYCKFNKIDQKSVDQDVRNMGKGIFRQLEWIAAQGHLSVVVGSAPHPPSSTAECMERKKRGFIKDCPEFVEPAFWFQKTNQYLQSIRHHPDFTKLAVFADMTHQYCRNATWCRQAHDGVPYYRDEFGHMLQYGTTPMKHMLLTRIKETTNRLNGVHSPGSAH